MTNTAVACRRLPGSPARIGGRIAPEGRGALRPGLLRRMTGAALAVAIAGVALPGCAPLAVQRDAIAGTAGAAAASTYTPTRGQPGKDVIWIPTPDRLVTRMLQLAQVTPADYVVDLGSGDGKIVIAAVREFDARGLGLEYNPEMVGLSRRNADRAGIADRALFRQADIFETDFSAASVVTMYLLPELNLRLRKTLMAMKPGTRLVSHQWTMGNWVADETSWVRASPIHAWIVPANAGGSWQLSYPQGGAAMKAAMSMTQFFQQITESAIEVDGLRNTLRSPRIDGDRIRFGFTDGTGVLRQFDGRISGSRITGAVTGPGGSTAPFSAERTGATPPIGGSQGYSDEESIRVGAELGGQ